MEKATPSRVSRIQWAIAFALILCAVAGIYAQSLGFGFIDLDDGVYVTQNLHVIAGLSTESVNWAFNTLHGGFWIPVTWLSLMADQTLFGGGAAGYHFTNMLLHGANCLLVLWVLFFYTRAFRPSLIAALIFAVHPLHVESVAWVSERKDVLFAFFFLVALAAHGQYARTKKMKWAGALLAAAFLSLASKPMAVSLPLVLLLLDYWPLDRFSREHWKKILFEKIPLAGMCLTFGLVTLYAQNLYHGIRSLETVPIGARIGNAIYSCGWYAWKSLCPTGLGVFYPHHSHSMTLSEAIAAGLFFALATSIAWKFRKKFPWLATGWFFYLVTILPVIGLVQSGIQGMADRFMYVPLLGLIVALVWTADWIVKRGKVQHIAVAMVAGVWIITLFGLASVQAGYWRDSITLYSHTLEVTKNNFMVHEYLGASLAAQGHYQEASREYRKSLAINPNHGDALYGLGYLAVKKGDFEEGVRLFSEALKAEPGHVEALYGLATAQMYLGRTMEARRNLEKVLTINPGHATAMHQLKAIMNGDIKHRKE